MGKAKRTTTSAFGSAGRVSHDASGFYASRMYQDAPGAPGEKYWENPLPEALTDQLVLGSSTDMSQLPDCSVHLMVTSPPYNVGKEYDQDLTLDEYRSILRQVWQETFRVLVPGGRACVNVANLGRKPYIPLHALIVDDLQSLGYLMRGEVIWDKGASSAGSTAWGSWLSATNPTLRDEHEYILIFSKGSFRRDKLPERKSTISREEFLEYTRSVWTFPAKSARKIGHPAPFPIELPYRLIQLYTFAGEVVLDPFIGSGQTALAALKAGRRFVGYEIDPNYYQLALRRIESEDLSV